MEPEILFKKGIHIKPILFYSKFIIFLGNQQLPAGAAKPLSPSTPSSTLLSKTKPKLQGAQAAASHNIRRVEREKARSRQHRRESRKGQNSYIENRFLYFNLFFRDRKERFDFKRYNYTHINLSTSAY